MIFVLCDSPPSCITNSTRISSRIEKVLQLHAMSCTKKEMPPKIEENRREKGEENGKGKCCYYLISNYSVQPKGRPALAVVIDGLPVLDCAHNPLDRTGMNRYS